MNGLLKNPQGQTDLDSVFLKLRWVLCTCYIIVGLSIIPILILISQKIIHMFQSVFGIIGYSLTEKCTRDPSECVEYEAMHMVLDIVDLTLINNLVVMVVYISYVTYVSETMMSKGEKYLPWLSALKNGSFEGVHRVKLLFITSLVMISAVHLLEVTLKVEEHGIDTLTQLWVSTGEIGLCITVLFSLVICGLVIAKINQFDNQNIDSQNTRDSQS